MLCLGVLPSACARVRVGVGHGYVCGGVCVCDLPAQRLAVRPF